MVPPLIFSASKSSQCKNTAQVNLSKTVNFFITVTQICLFFSVDMKYMLETALTVFENLLKMCIKDPAEAKNIPFADFLDALISISSAAGATGHIMLIRSVQGWINVGYVPTYVDNRRLIISKPFGGTVGIVIIARVIVPGILLRGSLRLSLSSQ